MPRVSNSSLIVAAPRASSSAVSITVIGRAVSASTRRRWLPVTVNAGVGANIRRHLGGEDQFDAGLGGERPQGCFSRPGRDVKLPGAGGGGLQRHGEHQPWPEPAKTGAQEGVLKQECGESDHIRV
jgi:hypothetical protein